MSGPEGPDTGGDNLECSWCGRTFTAPVRPGPPPRYCSRSHRQRAYEARKAAAAAAGRGDALREAARAEHPRSGPPEGRRRHVPLSVFLLGPVEALRADEAPIPLGPVLKAVLARLALRPGRVVPAATLGEAIWPGIDDRVGHRRLRTAVWALRKALTAPGEDGRRLIRWSAPGYALEIDDGRLDWMRFGRLRAAGEAALRRGAPALAGSYLSAALALWRGDEALGGIEVSADDLSFVADLSIAREQARRSLITARFRLGRYREVLPEVEALVSRDPVDDEAVWQLALSHARLGNPRTALSVCQRYVRLAEEQGLIASPRIIELESAVLRRDPWIDGRAPPPDSGALGVVGSDVGRRAFLACTWEPIRPSRLGPMTADLYLLVEEGGGDIHAATGTSVEASFAEPRAALQTAIALLASLDRSPPARVGVDVVGTPGASDVFDGPPRARARLLASAAALGQILVSGDRARALEASLPPRSELEALGRHRLNVLTPAAPIYRLTSPELPPAAGRPRWFDPGGVRNLAEDPYRFLGRQREVAQVTGRLTEARLVTITGAPGSGKTRLAAEVARALSGEHQSGAWFVDLRPLSQAGLVAATVAEGLQVPRAGPVPSVEALARFLARRHALVVLDNCEHVLAECRELVDRLLPACPRLAVLATSREALHSRLEQVVHVTPLEPPPLRPPEAIAGNPAVQLFNDRLGSEPAASDADLSVVARICRAVEAIPLALVLAAARARELGLVPLADALEEGLGEGRGLRILSGATGHPSADRETLDGTMEWSYRLLPERERRLFESLSVFRGGFPPEDATAVCRDEEVSAEDVLPGLQHLTQASLLTVERGRGGANVFRLLQPVRDYASAKLLARRGEAQALRRRHAERFLAIAEEAEPSLRGSGVAGALDRLDAALPDLYTAIRWTTNHGEARTALRLTVALWVYWLMRGRLAEGREMLQAALATDRTLSRERIRALTATSHLCWFGGDVAAALEALLEGFALTEAIGDDWAWAMLPLGLAAVEMFLSDEAFVPLRVEEILPRFRALGHGWETGQALQTLGGAAWYRGQYERAERAFSEAITLYRDFGHPTLMASLFAHGLMLALLGHLDAGAAEVDEAIARSHEGGDLVDLGLALCHRAAIARYGGHHDLARRYYAQALRTSSDAGRGWATQWALDGLGSTEALGLRAPAGRLEASVQLLARAEAMAGETGISLPPRERAYHAEDLKRARARLGDEAFRAAFQRGERLTADQAIELGLTLEAAGATAR